MSHHVGSLFSCRNDAPNRELSGVPPRMCLLSLAREMGPDAYLPHDIDSRTAVPEMCCWSSNIRRQWLVSAALVLDGMFSNVDWFPRVQ